MSAVIYRFTPPTCTLEIIGRESPFACWTNSNSSKQHQFKLKFDDPRQTTSSQVTIEGSEQELAMLQRAIEQYLQGRLQKTDPLDLESSLKALDSRKPYLKPQGLVHHELFFGCLTHDSDRHKIELGTVQLFDLATALETYQAQLSASSIPTRKRPWQSAGAVGGVIAAVAVAAVAIDNWSESPTQQNRIISQSQPSSDLAEVEEITPPVKPRDRHRAANPKLTEPLASTQRLPPPPAVETPKPKPDIPDPADYSLSRVGQQSGLDNSSSSTIESNRDRVASKAVPAESVVKIPTAVETEERPKSVNSDERTKPDSSLATPENDTKIENELAASSFPKLNELEQVKAFFQNRWEPPTELQQSLEYRLRLNPNGSVAKITPFGKLSRHYLNRIQMPGRGETIISPKSDSSPLVIRLLLDPDGRVQAFTE